MTQPEERSVSPITEWMTTAEVAQALGVSVSRVIQLANYGRLPHVRISNGTRLYDPEAVGVEAAARER